MAKKAEKNVVEEVFVPEGAAVVETHLDRDPNDVRLKPPVDGNSLPVVDINVPL